MKHHSSVGKITNSSTVIFSTKVAADAIVTAMRQLLHVLNEQSGENVQLEAVIDIDQLAVLVAQCGEETTCEDNENTALLGALPWDSYRRLE